MNEQKIALPVISKSDYDRLLSAIAQHTELFLLITGGATTYREPKHAQGDTVFVSALGKNGEIVSVNRNDLIEYTVRFPDPNGVDGAHRMYRFSEIDVSKD